MKFKDENNNNCLIATLKMISYCFLSESSALNSTFTSNSSSDENLFRKMEETIIFLIEDCEKHGLSTDSILNHQNEIGETLFYYASMYSEKVSLFLLKRNVKINTVNQMFMTPSFRVNICFM